MRTELEREYEKVMKKFRASNIRPQMKMIVTNGKPSGTFDLRELNQEIAKNGAIVPPR